jgi:hypothetical protein
MPIPRGTIFPAADNWVRIALSVRNDDRSGRAVDRTNPRTAPNPRTGPNPRRLFFEASAAASPTIPTTGHSGVVCGFTADRARNRCQPIQMGARHVLR